MNKRITSICQALIFAALIFWGPVVSAQQMIGKTTSINLATASPYGTAGAGEVIESFRIHKKGAPFIIPHFTSFSLNHGDYVEVRDRHGMLSQVITNEEPGKRDFWAFAVDGDTAVIDLIAGPTGGGKAPGFRIDQYGYGTAPMVRESICGTDDKVDIACLAGTPQYQRARSVGRMYFKDGSNWYLCTGALVSSEGHFLTNQHCVSSEAVLETLQVRFNYQYTTCGGGVLATYETFYGDTFLVANETYDCALMTLAGDPQTTYGYLELDPRDLALGETVYIPQHPGGVPKKYDDGAVVDPVATGYEPGSDVGYQVDTEGGSSGSPVLSMADHKVVGLHHFGGCNPSPPYDQNQGVLMKKVYPVISPYLPGGTYAFCFEGGGWTKEFDLVDGMWLVGEGKSQDCGISPLLGWLLGPLFGFNWDIETGVAGCAESVFYLGHLADLSYHYINTGGGTGTGTMVPCDEASTQTGSDQTALAGMGFTSEQGFCLMDNLGNKHTMSFDGTYLTGETETVSCGTVPLIGAVEGGLFSFYVDIPTGTAGCGEGMVYVGFISNLLGVFRTEAGDTGFSPCGGHVRPPPGPVQAPWQRNRGLGNRMMPFFSPGF